MDLEQIVRDLQRRGYLDTQLPNGSIRRADANETLAFARQLEFIMTEVQVAETIEMRARELFPTIVIPDWADTHTHTQIQRIGKAVIASTNTKSNEVPQVELFGKQYQGPVRSLLSGYNYSIDDVRRSVVTGINVDTEKALGARKAINELEESLCYTGDEDSGILGIFSTAVGATSVTQVSTYDWDHASNTAQGMLADVNALLMATYSATRGKHTADTLCLGTKAFGIAMSTYNSPTFTTDTVASFLLRAQPWLKSIEHVPWLDDLGGSNKERQFVYRKDPQCLRMVIAQEFEQTAPQQRGWNIFIDCREKFGGIEVRHPKSIAYMDGLINAAGLTGGSTLS